MDRGERLTGQLPGRLASQTGYVPTNTIGKSALFFGASGVLTNPTQDQRMWAWAYLYDSGKLEITGTRAPDASRQVLATGCPYTNAHYQIHAAMPWYDARSDLR
jgi:hypothetical protein